MESEAIQDELQSLELEINDVQGLHLSLLPIYISGCFWFWIRIIVIGQISALIEHQDRLYERKSELKTLLKAVSASVTPVAPSCPDGSSAVENWSEPFEWDSRADDIRFNIFGISKYRANQREVSCFCFCFCICFMSFKKATQWWRFNLVSLDDTTDS